MNKLPPGVNQAFYLYIRKKCKEQVLVTNDKTLLSIIVKAFNVSNIFRSFVYKCAVAVQSCGSEFTRKQNVRQKIMFKSCCTLSGKITYLYLKRS